MIEIMKECDDCFGKGTVDVMSCHTDSNECCGGCYKEVVCNECFGSGEMEDWKAEDVADELTDLMEHHSINKDDLIRIIKIM